MLSITTAPLTTSSNLRLNKDVTPITKPTPTGVIENSIDTKGIRIYEDFSKRALQITTIVSEDAGVSSDSILSDYRFDGDTVDSKNPQSRCENSQATLTTGRFNLPNTAYHFNGNAFLDCGRITVGKNIKSIETWVKLDPHGDTIDPIVSKMRHAAGIEIVLGPKENGLHFYTCGDNVCANGDNAQIATIPYKALQFNHWMHVVATQQGEGGTETRLYLNGTVYATGITSLKIADISSLLIGSWHGDTQRKLHGDVDEVTLYSQALTQSQVMQRFQEGQIPPEGTSRPSVQPTFITNSPSPLVSQSGSIISPGIILSDYRFDGDTVDSKNPQNRCVNSQATLTTGRFNLPNTAYHFDGNAFLDCGHIAETKNIKTIETWVKLDSHGNSIDPIVSQMRYAAGIEIVLGPVENGLHFYTCGDSVCANGDNRQIATIPYGALQFNNWMHVVATQEGEGGTETRLYLNGTVHATGITSLKIADISSLLIGSWHGDDFRKLHGDVDEVTLYSQALTQAQVTQRFQQGQIPPEGVRVPSLQPSFITNMPSYAPSQYQSHSPSFRPSIGSDLNTFPPTLDGVNEKNTEALSQDISITLIIVGGVVLLGLLVSIVVICKFCAQNLRPAQLPQEDTHSNQQPRLAPVAKADFVSELAPLPQENRYQPVPSAPMATAIMMAELVPVTLTAKL